MKWCYTKKRFGKTSKTLIEQVDSIMLEYAAQGYDMTLRQVYYKLVARDLFPDDRCWRQLESGKWVRDPKGTKNAEPNYKWLGVIVNDARLAGLLDWDHMVDRTREIRHIPHWESPSEILRACADQFRVDTREGQEYLECFAPETPVVTPVGSVPIAAMEVGDLVLTHKGNWKPVTKTIRNEYHGRLLEIKAIGLPAVRITPSHPIWVHPYNDNLPGYKGKSRRFLASDWVRADSLKQFDLLTVPRPILRTELPTKVSLVGGVRSRAISFPLNDLTWGVIGLYLAEGSVRPDGRTVQFTFSEKEQSFVEYVSKWAEMAGVTATVAHGPGTAIVYVFSKALTIWLSENFGNGAYHKRIPDWVMTGSVAAQLHLLQFYFMGDGCFSDRSRSAADATTRSQQLAQQVQLMLLWAGFSTSQDEVVDHGEPRYRVSVGGESAVRLVCGEWHLPLPVKGVRRSRRYNHITFDNSGSLHPVKSHESRDPSGEYRGYVYNLEVADDQSYCVPFAVHNCWVEKEAMAGIVVPVCQEMDIPCLVDRGFVSQSAMYYASKRFGLNGGTVLYLGDHDPSGIDMSRDIDERLNNVFVTLGVTVERLALNMDQVEEYQPPPNPAKEKDSRYESYREQYGDECWELDALEPSVITQLIRDGVARHTDANLQKKYLNRQEKGRRALKKIAKEMDGKK